jgi:hypothetical protein
VNSFSRSRTRCRSRASASSRHPRPMPTPARNHAMKTAIASNHSVVTPSPDQPLRDGGGRTATRRGVPVGMRLGFANQPTSRWIPKVKASSLHVSVKLCRRSPGFEQMTSDLLILGVPAPEKVLTDLVSARVPATRCRENRQASVQSMLPRAHTSEQPRGRPEARPEGHSGGRRRASCGSHR